MFKYNFIELFDSLTTIETKVLKLKLFNDFFKEENLEQLTFNKLGFRSIDEYQELLDLYPPKNAGVWHNGVKLISYNAGRSPSQLGNALREVVFDEDTLGTKQTGAMQKLYKLFHGRLPSSGEKRGKQKGALKQGDQGPAVGA